MDVAVEGFIKRPPPVGTLLVDLIAQQVAQLIQAEEEPIPSEEEQKEVAKENSAVDLEEDFKVFYRPTSPEGLETSSRPQPSVQISVDQEVTDVLEGMVLQKMTPNLLALLEAHASVEPTKALVAPRPPTPIPYR